MWRMSNAVASWSSVKPATAAACSFASAYKHRDGSGELSFDRHRRVCRHLIGGAYS
jgi:hypothetical protein